MIKRLSAEKFIEQKEEKFEKELHEKKTRSFKDIGRKGEHHFLREGWTFMQQSNLAEKVFIIERWRRIKITGVSSHKHIKVGDIEYRFGYFIVGKNGNKKGKWTWGQYCPLIPVKDLDELLKKAKLERTIR